MRSDEEIERLQAESRRLASEQLSQRQQAPNSKFTVNETAYDNWERLVYSRLPEYKSYPLIALLRVVLAGFGWFVFIGGVFGLLTSFAGSYGNLQGIGILESSAIKAGRAILFIASLLSSIMGLGAVTSSEALKLAMDIAENEDRQSIIAFATYQLLLSTRKDDADGNSIN